MDQNMACEERSESPLRWNPPVPADFEQYDELLAADTIAGTAFCQKWLFTVLMKLIQFLAFLAFLAGIRQQITNKQLHVDLTRANTLLLEVDKQNEPGNEDSDFGVDVDGELQDELCSLWDMSMNSDVVVFMQEFKSVELLSAVIVKSRAPRVTEICVGILGNLACSPIVCAEMSANPVFINMVLVLLENPDGLCLVQIVRLLYSCLQCEGNRAPWTVSIKQRESVILEQLKFIMSSSTNVDLLKNVGELINLLLYVEDELCVRWSSVPMLTAMLEAIKEIGYEPCPALEVYIHNFQLISCSQIGAEALEEVSEPLLKLLMKYLISLCDEPIVPVDMKAKYLAAILSLINLIFLQHPKFDIDSFYKGEMFPKCLFKILESLFPYIYHAVEILLEDSKVPQEEVQSGRRLIRWSSCSVVEDLASFKRYRWEKDVSDCDEALVVLYKALHASFLSFIWLIPKKTTEESMWSPILHYLDTECSELHLRYLILMAQDQSSEIKNPVEHLKEVSDSNGLYRLHHVVVDTVGNGNDDDDDDST